MNFEVGHTLFNTYYEAVVEKPHELCAGKKPYPKFRKHCQ